MCNRLEVAVAPLLLVEAVGCTHHISRRRIERSNQQKLTMQNPELLLLYYCTVVTVKNFSPFDSERGVAISTRCVTPSEVTVFFLCLFLDCVCWLFVENTLF